jgi:hypothetical protein
MLIRNKKKQSWVWLGMPAIPALWKLKWKDCEFKANQHRKTLSQKNKKTQPTQNNQIPTRKK